MKLQEIKNKCYKDFKSKQGYKILSFKLTTLIEIHKGAMGICDSCNKAGFDGYYIPVLNRWYCESCFKEFEERTPFYEDDLEYENLNYNNMKKTLNVYCDTLFKIFNMKN